MFAETLNLTQSKDSATLIKRMYIESYGCQMNFSDSEIVTSILEKEGYTNTNEIEHAELVLINT